jgi:hypothetical protein
VKKKRVRKEEREGIIEERECTWSLFSSPQKHTQFLYHLNKNYALQAITKTLIMYAQSKLKRK